MQVVDLRPNLGQHRHPMDPVPFARLAAWAKLNPCPSLALQFQARVARLWADATCLEALRKPLDPASDPSDPSDPSDQDDSAPRTRPDETEQPLLQDEVLQGVAEIRDGMVALPRMTGS